jgi:uncharacterized protein
MLLLMHAAYPCFGLVLTVNHACNLRCTYCYTGEKFNRRMSFETGQRAIERALASIAPGGRLELGFFGGEPLLEAELIGRFLDYTTDGCSKRGMELSPGLTTNGTIVTPAAWTVMMRPDLDLIVSHDGAPRVHDRHRRGIDGSGTSSVVAATIRRLIAAGKDIGVQMVVRPDTVNSVVEGIEYLRSLGVRRIEPSLDLWTRWTPADIERLSTTIAQGADVWRAGLPHNGIGWFDGHLANLCGVPTGGSARCGFGNGEIAVAPSGNLYPCERLIGEDAADNPMRLPGHALDGGEDFLGISCNHGCASGCQCSNYVRSGDAAREDSLITTVNHVCAQQTQRVCGINIIKSSKGEHHAARAG